MHNDSILSSCPYSNSHFLITSLWPPTSQMQCSFVSKQRMFLVRYEATFTRSVYRWYRLWFFQKWTTKWKATKYPLSSVQSLSRVQIFVTPWTAAHQASLSITNPRSLLKLMSIETVMLPSPNNLILVIPFSWLQSFPASRSFPMSQFFASGGQSIDISASASVLPMNIQD